MFHSYLADKQGEDTFVRPMYAGNAIATVKSNDATKVFTVRTTAFEAAAASGGGAAVEDAAGAGDAGMSTWVRPLLLYNIIMSLI